MSKKTKPLLHDWKLTWKQTAAFKLATISFGILLAVYFPIFFSQYVVIFWITCVVAGIYIAYIYLKR